MSKFLSGRQSNLKLGVAGYTESKTVLETTGKVGIGTTDAQSNSLYVVGDTNVVGHTETDTLRVSGVSTFQSNVHLGDGDNLLLGDSNDLQIVHDGSNSWITDAGTGYLGLVSNGTGVMLQKQGGEFLGKFINDGAVELYHNNSKKLETISDGVKITGELQVTDDITAFFSSDERLKLNITPIKEPLAKVLSISGNTFTWIEGGVHEGEDTGVIAQEIDALGLPGLTVTRETGYMAVKYDKLTALLIEAVKELSAKVDILEQKLSDK